MNFLILSVTAGEGHNSTAKAIREDLEKHDASAEILDTFEYISPEFAKLLADGYLFVTEKAQGMYRIGYRMAEKRKVNEKLDVIRLVSKTLSKDLVEYINSDSRDVVIFTHPFAGMLLDTMKKKKLIDKRTVGILTDFTFHPFWEDCTANDYVVVPNRLLLPQAKAKGFREEQILPFGIPIHPKFRGTDSGTESPAENREKARVEAREKLGLDRDVNTLLVMGGSMGYGNMEELVRRIDGIDTERPFQMIAVAGRNEPAKTALDRLAENARHKLLVTGFVDYVSTLMDAADCIITKPGGLTTSESLAKTLSEKWKAGLEKLSKAASEDGVIRDIRDCAEAAYCCFRAMCLQTRFNRLRGDIAAHRDELIALAEEEKSLALRLADVQAHDPCIGFESTNHYFYTRSSLIEAALSCDAVLEELSCGLSMDL